MHKGCTSTVRLVACLSITVAQSAVARNRLASRQALVSTNFFARRAEYAFMEDQRIADTYHSLLRGKWANVSIMDQPHLNTQSDQWPYSMRNTLPPVSLVNPFVPSRPGNLNNAPAQPGYVRITVENNYASLLRTQWGNASISTCSSCSIIPLQTVKCAA
jgi:hypothetical protein